MPARDYRSLDCAMYVGFLRGPAWVTKGIRPARDSRTRWLDRGKWAYFIGPPSEGTSIEAGAAAHLTEFLDAFDAVRPSARTQPDRRLPNWSSLAPSGTHPGRPRWRPDKGESCSASGAGPSGHPRWPEKLGLVSTADARGPQLPLLLVPAVTLRVVARPAWSLPCEATGQGASTRGRNA